MECLNCKQKYTYKKSLDKHIQNESCIGVDLKRTCEYCSKQFSTHYTLARHGKLDS